MNLVDIHRLKPHPKNLEYFGDLDGSKYEEIRQSIQANGIRDPLKVTPDLTILAGHQRYRIAKELGIEQVPVTICDVSQEEAEYLLIADNEERRGTDDDPMRKARRAKFLKEYWGIRGRGPKSFSQNGENPKSSRDVAKAVGTSADHLPRLLKLNDLIAPLQSLVSSGKLSTTAAEQLAHLSSDVQKALFETLGEGIGLRTVAETRELRQQLADAERKAKEQAESLRQRGDTLERQLEQRDTHIQELQASLQQTAVSAQVVEVVPEEIQARLRVAEEERDRLREQLAFLRRKGGELKEQIPAIVQGIQARDHAKSEAFKSLSIDEHNPLQDEIEKVQMLKEFSRFVEGGTVGWGYLQDWGDEVLERWTGFLDRGGLEQYRIRNQKALEFHRKLESAIDRALSMGPRLVKGGEIK